jgi:hypothetical protein
VRVRSELLHFSFIRARLSRARSLVRVVSCLHRPCAAATNPAAVAAAPSACTRLRTLVRTAAPLSRCYRTRGPGLVALALVHVPAQLLHLLTPSAWRLFTPLGPWPAPPAPAHAVAPPRPNHSRVRRQPCLQRPLRPFRRCRASAPSRTISARVALHCAQYFSSRAHYAWIGASPSVRTPPPAHPRCFALPKPSPFEPSFAPVSAVSACLRLGAPRSARHPSQRRLLLGLHALQNSAWATCRAPARQPLRLRPPCLCMPASRPRCAPLLTPLSRAPS